MKTFQVKSVDDWQPVAQEVAKQLRPGMIVTLSGALGVGKTTFVQALAKELGAKKLPKSPTFSLVRTYALRRGAIHRAPSRLVHVDAYRLEKPDDIRVLNLEEELSEPGTVMVIEWPEQIENWLRHLKTSIIEIRIESTQTGFRKVIIHT